MSTRTVTILGCGNSTGIPAIGNYWGDCDPLEPKNSRSRTSMLLEQQGKYIVIDTGPDFRTQINRENIPRVDAVLFSHQHSDHVNGIDELRVVRHRNGLDFVPCYGNEFTINDLQARFHYLFEGGNHELYPPIIKPHVIASEDFGKPHTVQGIDFMPFEQDHGTCKTVGYRFGDFAYSVDIVSLHQTAIETLRGVKTWIVDAAAYNQDSNPVHANLQTIYDLNAQIGAKNVILTSLSLSMDYQTLKKELPEGYVPAYDGMKIEL
jgi:phosphoribosyl 1,2-cyclic phosphate phosphodiesterase